MRALLFLPLPLLALSTASPPTCPFLPALAAPLSDLPLAKRQSCAANYAPCANAAYCCRADTVCQTDYQGQVACCPQGAACTGVVFVSSASSAVGGSTIGGSFVLATTTAAAGNAGGVMVGTSTVAFVGGVSGAGRRVDRGALGVVEAVGRVARGWVWGFA